MPRRTVRAAACLCLIACVAPAPAAQDADLSALDRTIAAAEASLQSGERQLAESHYRTALVQAWMLAGALHVTNGRLTDARLAFERASTSAVENQAALQSLAIVQVQLGESDDALAVLTAMAAASPRDVQVRRTLAQALVAAGKPREAVQELEEALALAPQDAELMFALASGYVRVKKVEAAEQLFARVLAARPLPETHVLIGRTYRDLQMYDKARQSLRRALQLAPRTRRAHYYLGTVAVMEEGVVKLDEAIAEFRRELEISPGDPLATLRLGMALVESRAYDDAMPLLDSAVRSSASSADAWLYRGRCQLALGRPADAVVSLRRALDTAGPKDAGPAIEQVRLRTIHYQLATALRDSGQKAEAEREFAEAQRLSARRTEADREQLAQYMNDARDASPASLGGLPLAVAGGLEALPADKRSVLMERVNATLVRTYLNLGIMQVQAERFARAVELLDLGAAIDPAFPQVQYSLGVAAFNAQQYDKAAAALGRALEQQPQHPEARRMLALAALNAEDYVRAADLLRSDPALPTDPSLQYAYGVALVRSDRAREAEQIFTRVLAQHPDSPELNVVMGQAYAAQGDYESAIKSLRRAIAIKKDVAEAHAALGVIYLQQGQLAPAAEALRAELAVRPRDIRTRYTLATVLDLDSRPDDALTELRAIISANPAHADSRYLSGKILLARGDAADAVAHLEVAARLSPDDANIHYQLGLAYQRTGRTEMAAREFDTFKRLKDKQRGGTP